MGVSVISDNRDNHFVEPCLVHMGTLGDTTPLHLPTTRPSDQEARRGDLLVVVLECDGRVAEGEGGELHGRLDGPGVADPRVVHPWISTGCQRAFWSRFRIRIGRGKG